MNRNEYVNKENATPTMSLQVVVKQPAAPEVRIRVGGVLFVLDQTTLQKLNSEHLNQRIGVKDAEGGPESSPSTQGGLRKTSSQDDAAVLVFEEADAESFSAFVHMARYGTLPTSIFSKEKRELLLQQADSVWGIRPRVEEALEKARKEFRQNCNCADAVNRCLIMSPLAASKPPVDKQQKKKPFPVAPVCVPTASAKTGNYASVPVGSAPVCLGGPHHNFRRDDGSRRVFCSSCGHRDIDWRYHVGDFYSNCQKCQKDILYKPDLGWCHKCRQCTDCQTAECPGVPIKQLNEQVIPFMMTSLKANESALSFF